MNSTVIVENSSSPVRPASPVTKAERPVTGPHSPFQNASMPPGEKYRPYPQVFHPAPAEAHGSTLTGALHSLYKAVYKFLPRPAVSADGTQAILWDRTWPQKQITKAPIWCSVDLRDGNQALKDPMDVTKKLVMFLNLVRIGFKEIEIGFPSANDTEFGFTRTLIDKNFIPHWVTPQVLTQAREHLIRRTFEALEGTPKAIVHVYNSTSDEQRRIVFDKDKAEIIKIAVDGVRLIKELAAKSKTAITLQYSPESFTGTETVFAKEICDAVIDAWQPTPRNKLIINLPATVEMSTPNHFADQVEWMSRYIKKRDCVTISIHTHNDRSTGVAATELGLMAGADRVEGTLFGNGERTGNADLVSVALNMYTRGIDPRLDFRDMPRIQRLAEFCTGMQVPPRQAYAGELVFTAFSGSHQDAIEKGLKYRNRMNRPLWEIPYVPLDPQDINREYQFVRINSQSGKGGVAHVLYHHFGCELPKKMQVEFGAVMKTASDRLGGEVAKEMVWQIFEAEYLKRDVPYRFIDAAFGATEPKTCRLTLAHDGGQGTFAGSGSGSLAACVDALRKAGCPELRIVSMHDHSRNPGTDAEAVAYIELEMKKDGKTYVCHGAGIDRDTQKAPVLALFSAVNRCIAASET